jgi:hypothetical protein
MVIPRLDSRLPRDRCELREGGPITPNTPVLWSPSRESPFWLWVIGGLGLGNQSGLNKSLLTSGSLWTFLRCFLGWPQNSHEGLRKPARN